MWHIDAEIISLIFMAVILFDILKSSADFSLKNKLFNILAVTTVLAIVADIISSYAMIQYQTSSWWFIEGSLLIYFILTPMLSALWCLYAIAVICKISKVKYPYLFAILIPFIIYTAIVLSNPYTGWLFDLSATKEYARGPLFNSMYVIFYGYSLATLILACFHLNKIERTTSIVLIIFPLIAGFGIYLQQILPTYLITGASFTLVLLITYMFLQNRKATRDHLTGLFNRIAFSTTIDRISKSNEHGVVLAAAIDDFKIFNQNFGQKNGDKLLQKVANYLVDISPNKTCYRYGGDIFTIILKKNNEQEGLLLAGKIVEKFSKSFYIDGVGYSVSLSLGLVEYPNDHNDKGHSIITALDFAVYQAKKRGKGQIAFFNEALISQFKRKYEIMEAITKALENGSFDVYLQPIHHTKKKKFTYAEALLRLNDEKIGRIAPDELIPIAEETGQIVEITYFVLEQACSFIKKNQDILNDEISISVNFSVIQFMQNDMVEKIKAIIKSYDIPPHLIKIEVTESVIADSFEDIKSVMVQLNDFGIQFALDDYGQGYSNISYLINLPFTFVKLDKSIIDTIAEDKKIICSLVPMFKNMDKKLVAEGVETKEQVDILNELYCDTIQGYYFSKPLPMNEAVELFKKV